MVKKISFSICVIVAFFLFAVWKQKSTNDFLLGTTRETQINPQRGLSKFFIDFGLLSDTEDEENANTTPIPTQPPETTSVAQGSTKGRYRDGVFTGKVADAYYGNLRVRITIAGGAITDVAFLDYPQDRITSLQINDQAMPYLREEAIQAQSANVDIVSGATASSLAFQESLASALAQAN